MHLVLRSLGHCSHLDTIPAKSGSEFRNLAHTDEDKGYT